MWGGALVAAEAGQAAKPPRMVYPVGGLQGHREGVLDRLAVDELQALALVFRYLRDVALVARGEHHTLDARALGGQRLFLHAADRQDLTGKRHLSGHGDVPADRLTAYERRQGN